MYALFDGQKQIGQPFPTEMEVWEHAVKEGLVEDIPVADEAGGPGPAQGISRREDRRTNPPAMTGGQTDQPTLRFSALSLPRFWTTS
jgi:hypothetical protein